jgi:hypothetical protein
MFDSLLIGRGGRKLFERLTRCGGPRARALLSAARSRLPIRVYRRHFSCWFIIYAVTAGAERQRRRIHC